MKCPKCGYLGFETVDRCRNCGYDFSLTSSPTLPELSIRTTAVETGGPLDDLDLAPPALPATADRVRASARTERESSSDLPLFGAVQGDDAPLITRASPPRPPLAVRRATPEVPRLRTGAKPSLLDQVTDLEEPPTLWRPPPSPAAAPATTVVSRGVPRASVATGSAGLVARTMAGVVDISVLIVVDAIVVYFTLEICGLAFNEMALLPKGPLVTFLVMLNLGYFAAFTAGGQTLGKMVTGVRVVAEGTDRSPGVAQALLRTVLWLVLALPAGLGLASVLLDSDKRGLHDRFARTRVVRATH